jgi:predicted dehydrogenase
VSARRRLGVGVVGFGWMGHAHSRSMLRLPTLFPERGFDPWLVVCADTVPERLDEASSSFGFAATSTDWRAVAGHRDVDLVVIAAPNGLHRQVAAAAAAEGKHVFCEKPVGSSAEDTEAAAAAVRAAGVVSAAGFNYRWAPMVQEAHRLIGDGAIGRLTSYRGRFLSMYGNDPQGVLSWRYQIENGRGASTDLLCHAVDMAQHLAGPITRVVGTSSIVIPERPLPEGDGTSHYARGRAGAPTGRVTNEDYVALLGTHESGVTAILEACRTGVGPESQMAFEVYGTEGALSWNLERMNELQLYLRSDGPLAGYRTIFSGERFFHHRNFVPGNANGIGFEDLVAIEDYELGRAIIEGREFRPSFEDAAAAVRVQSALLRSVETGAWETVAESAAWAR